MTPRRYDEWLTGAKIDISQKQTRMSWNHYREVMHDLDLGEGRGTGFARERDTTMRNVDPQRPGQTAPRFFPKGELLIMTIATLTALSGFQMNPLESEWLSDPSKPAPRTRLASPPHAPTDDHPPTPRASPAAPASSPASRC